MAEKKKPVKLIKFANPAVKAALDEEQNASALVEALVANYLNIPLDSNDPAQAERVAYLADIQDQTSAEPQGTVAELEGLELPVNTAVGIDLGYENEPALISGLNGSVLPDTERTLAEEFEEIQKPSPLSSDFTDLAGDPDEDTFTEAEPAPAESTEPTEPENTETALPAFVPVPKPDESPSSINKPAAEAAPTEAAPTEAAPAEDAPAEAGFGLKTCPNCHREVILDVCLNCGTAVN